MSDLPIGIEPIDEVDAEPKPRQLKSLEDHLAEVAARRPQPQPTGVACTDTVKQPIVRTRTRVVSRSVTVELEPFMNPKTFEMHPRTGVESIEEEEEIEETVDEIVGPCPGELMWDMPKLLHPQLPNLYRARCSVCGWRGWV